MEILARKIAVMLTALFYTIWGHWYKDDFEENDAQGRNLWL